VSDAFDPKVIYDPDSARFMFVTCANRRSANSAMLLAVSATSDPTGAWDMWILDGDGSDTNWVDYPNIGVNKKWITFTSNMFTISGDSFSGVNVWAVDKASALDGGDINATLFFQQFVGATHVPSLTFSPSEETQYLVSTWSSSGLLRLYTITGAAGSPVWTATDLYPSSAGWNPALPNAPQLGSPGLIATNDQRMINAVLRNGSLWCTHTVALPTGTADRTVAKWWEVNPTTGNTIQSGVVEDTVSGMFYYFPSITVNADDEVLIGFTGSSPATYAGGYYTYRNADTPSGTMRTVAIFKAGEQPYYKTYGGPSNRWGDYSATCVDPTDDRTMWTIQEYADTPENRWGPWWGQLAPLEPELRVKNGAGDTVAMFDEQGNLTLAGTLTENAAPMNTLDSEFLIKNAGEAIVALIDSNGNLTLVGFAHENETLLTPPPNSFIVENPDGDVIAYITAAGDLYLLGQITTGP
jgi:hypothetical protein